MSEDIERLASEVRSASNNVAMAEAQRAELKKRKDVLLEAYKKSIDEEFTERQAAIDSNWRTARANHLAAMTRYEIAVAEQAATNPIVGRRVFETKHVGFSVTGKIVPTGLKGIVEAFRPGDQHVGADHSRPRAGRFVIRVLKADGTPSKRCIEFHSDCGTERKGLPYSWQFEDEKKAD